MSASATTRVVVAVEGNIGAGKSTFLRAAAADLAAATGRPVVAVPEPVGAWTDVGGHNPLAAFYADPRRFAFTFQTLALASRIVELRKAVAASPPDALVLCERSLQSDHLFADNCRDTGYFSPMESAIYDLWWAAVSAMAPECQPDVVVYVRTPPTVCAARVDARNRREECAPKSALDVGYLAQLDALHEEYCAGALVLDGNVDYAADAAARLRAVQQIAAGCADAGSATR